MTEPALFSVNQLAEYLVTREQGREGRNRLEDLISENRGLDLTIDFEGVNVMTFSFADEFLGKFLLTLDAESHDLTVKLSGLDSVNAETVTVCLERRQLSVVALGREGTLSLIGESILEDTFQAAARLSDARAGDIARALSITPQNVNNRLKRLVAVGALRKVRNTSATRGGKEFLYSPPEPVAATC